MGESHFYFTPYNVYYSMWGGVGGCYGGGGGAMVVIYFSDILHGYIYTIVNLTIRVNPTKRENQRAKL